MSNENPVDCLRWNWLEFVVVAVNWINVPCQSCCVSKNSMCHFYLGHRSILCYYAGESFRFLLYYILVVAVGGDGTLFQVDRSSGHILVVSFAVTQFPFATLGTVESHGPGVPPWLKSRLGKTRQPASILGVPNIVVTS